jgi:leucyl aminopeptidase (aminopeptidase T)
MNNTSGMNFTICPVCGGRLSKIRINNNKYELYICRDSICRTTIQNNKVFKMELGKYCIIQDKISENVEDKKSNTYMLLKRDLSSPLLVKNTNSATEKNKNSYCIINAKSHEDAVKQFKDKFKAIIVTDDMVVNIEIKEI